MPTATDFKDYYATLGVPKTATPEEINWLTVKLPVSAIQTSILGIKPPRQISKISMKQMRHLSLRRKTLMRSSKNATKRFRQIPHLTPAPNYRR
jgi:hypothetical protein